MLHHAAQRVGGFGYYKQIPQICIMMSYDRPNSLRCPHRRTCTAQYLVYIITIWASPKAVGHQAEALLGTGGRLSGALRLCCSRSPANQTPARCCGCWGRDCRPSRRRLPANWRYHCIYNANHACKPVRHGPRCPDMDSDRGSAAAWTIGILHLLLVKGKMKACSASASSQLLTSSCLSFSFCAPTRLQRPRGATARDLRLPPTV